MRERNKFFLGAGIMLAQFAIWTLLVRTVDVQTVGPMGMSVGLAAINMWFHRLTGVQMGLYILTDWLGLVPVFTCLVFGALGLVQWIRRKSIRKVDPDLLWLGGYFLLVAAVYLFFEMVPVNYRPLLMEGRLEASYPSSTTLLVLSVMPTLRLQAGRRLKHAAAIRAAAIVFSGFMVTARLLSGVHWLSDIVGAILLSTGLFCMYRAVVV